ncbi:hypothetical protein MTIM_15040 [Mycobacterium timonense]|uniref:Uncharacterized protein n=1 Tax=Mycobacterium timonense TaxID=701043 RepID=A0A7I9Z443_9MYCO|nr:hypothetical protein MTIM_15040 [Mycobacterium timonense]
MRLTARARPATDRWCDQNAVTAVAEAVARLGRHQFPLVLTDTVAQFLEAVSEETGLTFDTDSGDLRGAVEKLGPMARMLKAVLHDTANPTMLKAGYRPTSSRRSPRRWWTAGSCPGARRRSRPRSTSCWDRT